MRYGCSFPKNRYPVCLRAWQTALVHTQNPPAETPAIQPLQQGIHLQSFADFDADHIIGKRRWIDHPLKQRPQDTNQHLLLTRFPVNFVSASVRSITCAVQLIEEPVRKESKKKILTLGEVFMSL